jgi:hypothetical protein
VSLFKNVKGDILSVEESLTDQPAIEIVEGFIKRVNCNVLLDLESVISFISSNSLASYF